MPVTYSANVTKGEIRSSNSFEKSENVTNSVTRSVTNGHRESKNITQSDYESTMSREYTKTNGWKEAGINYN